MILKDTFLIQIATEQTGCLLTDSQSTSEQNFPIARLETFLA